MSPKPDLSLFQGFCQDICSISQDFTSSFWRQKSLFTMGKWVKRYCFSWILKWNKILIQIAKIFISKKLYAFNFKMKILQFNCTKVMIYWQLCVLTPNLKKRCSHALWFKKIIKNPTNSNILQATQWFQYYYYPIFTYTMCLPSKYYQLIFIQ